MASVTGTVYLRTSIVLPERTVDVQLPSNSAVEDVVFELIRYLNTELSQKGLDTKWLNDADAVWTLSRFGRRQLDNDKSLAEIGVMDGERLWLSKNEKNEKYPALMDDLAQSIADQQKQFDKWEYETDAVSMASIVTGTVLSFLAVLTAFAVKFALPETLGGYRYAALGGVGALTILSATLAIIMSRSENKKLGTSLLIASYVNVASLSLMVIPRPPSLWDLATLGAVTLVFAFFMIPFTKDAQIIHSSVVTAATCITVTVIANHFFRTSAVSTAVQCASVAYLTLIISSKLGQSLGKMERPHVHAPGESVIGEEEGDDITDAALKSSGSDVIESVINHGKQSVDAHNYLIGVLLGAVSTIIVSCFFIGYLVAADMEYTVTIFTLSASVLATLFVLCTAVTIVNRGRNYIHKDVTALMVSAAGISVAAYVLGLSVSHPYDNLKQIIISTGAAAAVAIIASLWTLAQRQIKSPTTRYWTELLANMFYATPIIWMGWMMDTYMKVRNR